MMPQHSSADNHIFSRANKQHYWVLLTVLLLPALLRYFGQPWNLTPVGGMALFAGVYFRNARWAMAIPIVAMMLSDLTLGLMKGDMQTYTFHKLLPFVYGSYVLYVVLGHAVRLRWDRSRAQQREQVSPALKRGLRYGAPLGAATLAGSLSFFLITNFGVWLMYNTFPHTLSGLIACYIAGLPFLGHTMIGDGFYTGVFFGVYALVQSLASSPEQNSLHVETT